MSKGSLLAWEAGLTQLLYATCRVSVLLCLAVILLVALAVAHRIFLHPLARIPGPIWASISNAWLARHCRNGETAILARTLHHKYGPVVRVGPNEVWFDSKEAFKAIYSAGSGYEKSDFYLATALTRPRIDWRFNTHYPDTLDFLSERDMQRYRKQRRLVGPVYQTSNAIKYEQAVHEVVEEAITRIRALGGEEIDLKEWMHIIAVECLGRVVLSWSPGLLRHGTDWGTSAHSYLGWRRKTIFGLFPFMVKVEVCWKSLGRAFANAWGVTFALPEKFKPLFPVIQKRVTSRMNGGGRQPKTKSEKRNPKDKVGNEDLMEDLIRLHKKDKTAFTGNYLRRMAITNFGAGHETLASTLTSVFAMLGSHSNAQDAAASEVRQEAATTSPDKLKYLQAAIKEAKRLYPVIAMSLPRRVPATGLQLHGYVFPPGTTVGCSPIALHRNPAICCTSNDSAAPDAYDPKRWLASDAAAREMERHSLAWGGGARSCPGRHLAEMIVNRVVAGLLREFEVRATIPPEEERPAYFLSMLTGVKARFKPRD